MIEGAFSLQKSLPLEEARVTFYAYARRRVNLATSQEMVTLHENFTGRGEVPTASYNITWEENNATIETVSSRRVNSLRVLINCDLYDALQEHTGVDYSELIPFAIEHEIFEMWLAIKYGYGNNLTEQQRHVLARRREIKMAEEAGLGDKLLEFAWYVSPQGSPQYEEYRNTLSHLRGKKDKN